MPHLQIGQRWRSSDSYGDIIAEIVQVIDANTIKMKILQINKGSGSIGSTVIWCFACCYKFKTYLVGQDK